MNFEWLLFDLDNTILDFNASSKIGFKALLEKIDPELDAKTVYPFYRDINHKVWDEREAGLISHEELKTKRWDLFFKKVNIDYNPSEANDYYFEFIKSKPFFIDGAKELLDVLKGKIKLMIITNGLSEVQWSRLRIMDMEDYFSHIIISDEIGSAKPAKAFFEHCDELINYTSKDKVLVIGDTLKSDIKGGNEYGFKTCWYNYYKKENETQEVPDYSIQSLDELFPITGM